MSKHIVDGAFRLHGIEQVKLEAVQELLLASDRWVSAVQSSFGLESRQRAETELMRRVEHWRRVRDLKPSAGRRQIRTRDVQKNPKNPRRKRR